MYKDLHVLEELGRAWMCESRVSLSLLLSWKVVSSIFFSLFRILGRKLSLALLGVTRANDLTRELVSFSFSFFGPIYSLSRIPRSSPSNGQVRRKLLGSLDPFCSRSGGHYSVQLSRKLRLFHSFYIRLCHLASLRRPATEAPLYGQKEPLAGGWRVVWLTASAIFSAYATGRLRQLRPQARKFARHTAAHEWGF